MATPAHLPTPGIGTDAQFAALQGALEAAGYSEQAVCDRLDLQQIFDFRLQGAPYLEQDPADALGMLIRLLMECGPVSREATPGLPWEEMRALGLVKPHASQTGTWVSTAMLYPVRGLYIASDRTRNLATGGPPPDDFVYPALIANTGLFLSLIQSGPCAAFLDLCSGTGVAALDAARSGAREAWAFDLTERCAHYAEFNRRLNGLWNVTPGCGDLYEPGPGVTYDRIVAHPPYMPVYRPHMIFDSGGQDGEQIVRRIIEGLPEHLRPGGRFHALTMGTDRSEPFEKRLRRWLGEAEGEFDVAFVVIYRVTEPLGLLSFAPECFAHLLVPLVPLPFVLSMGVLEDAIASVTKPVPHGGSMIA